MRILISGSTGGIGSAVKSAAQACGWEISTVDRADYEAGELSLEGKFDAVVFATGCCPIKPAALLTDQQFEIALRVNCGYFLRLMRALISAKAYASTGTKVIAISSVSAVEGWPGGAAYCASKGALSAMCRALEVELASRKISVKALEPRYVKTKMFDSCAGRMGIPATEAIAPEVFAESIIKELMA